MLSSIHLKNYILIDNLNIEFADGLNIFTGETGAGKSIIFDAVGILLGDKITQGIIRKGANHCSVSGVFLVEKNPDALKLLSERGIDASEGQIIIRRETDSGGKSRCFINDEIVSVNFLSELGYFLLDIHGQNQHQSLLKLSYQRDFLDGYAGLEDELTSYRKIYDAWQGLKSKLESLNISVQERERLIDLYKFQVDEIKSANLASGDEESIREKLPQMKNQGKLKEVVSAMWGRVYEDDDSLTATLGKIRELMEKASTYGAPFEKYIDVLNETFLKIDELKDGISGYLDTVEGFDDRMIDELITKLDKIEKLRKKYGSTIEEINAYMHKAETNLENLCMSDDIRKDVEGELKNSEKKLNEAASKISKERISAAEKLSSSVLKELKDLGMPKSKFIVGIEKEQTPGPCGRDKVEFFFSANPGEDPRPLKEIISGGEMSRFMLALKTVESGSIPSLMFDELDAGLSGPMGQTVGKKLLCLSEKSQVISITHLPQIAAFARRHFVVEKSAEKDKTTTRIRYLKNEESVDEIARMLSGRKITDSAKQHAEELVEQARRASPR